jgi:hypothetical protein
MDRRFLPLAMLLLLEVAPGLAPAADSRNPQRPPVGASPSEQKPTDDPSSWQGFPNKGLRLPIRCPKKTLKRVSATTYLQLFANTWHDQPEPSSASDWQKASIQQDVRAIPPSQILRSVPEDGYAEVFALIGADGRVVEAFVVCSTDVHFHGVALTATRKSIYTPATVAGKPVASIVRRPYLFSANP